MFKRLEMIGLCILFNASLHLVPNNWLRDPSIELDHPPKTYIMILYCVILYPLNCSLSSQRRGPLILQHLLLVFLLSILNPRAAHFQSCQCLRLMIYYPCVQSFDPNFIIFRRLVSKPMCFNRSVKTAPPPWSRIWPFLAK